MKETNILQEMGTVRRKPSKPTLPQADVSNFQNIVKNRRSVRLFQNEPIPEAIVQDCLDLALLAPNSSNLQPWEFYRIKTPEKKKKLIEYCLSQPAAKTAAELIVCVSRPDTWRRNNDEMIKRLGTKAPKSALDYYKKIVPLMYNQGPLGLLGLAKRLWVTFQGLTKPIPREPMNPAQMDTWAQKSCALACENLMLAFRAYGYDTCPMEGLDSHRVKQLLNLPAPASIVMVIAAGKRAENGVYGPQIRFERSWFIKEI